MLAGLIGAAASGLKGAADAYSMGAKSEFDKNQKVSLSQQLLDMEAEKTMLLDKYKRDQDLAYLPKTAVAAAEAGVVGQVAGQTALKNSNLSELTAQNKVIAAQADDKYGVNLANAAATKAKFKAEKENNAEATTEDAKNKATAFIAATSMPNFLASVAKDKLAREGSDTKANAALATFQLATAKSIQLIQKEMMTAKANNDDAGYKAAEDKLKIMQGPPKSYAEVIKGAALLASQANDLLNPLTNNGLSNDIAQAQAAPLRQLAIDMVKSVADVRGMGGKPDAPGAASTVDPMTFDKRPKIGAAAAATKEAPLYEPPADSPAGKSKAMREDATLKSAAWDKEMSSKANTALTALDLNNLSAVNDFQQGELFRYLTPQQKAKVSKAVMGK